MEATAAPNTDPNVVDMSSDETATAAPPFRLEAAPTTAKKRNRQRLLRGLQRISSSPSLAQLGRSRAHSNPYGNRGSLSCVSLGGSGNGVAYYANQLSASGTNPLASQGSLAESPAEGGPGPGYDNDESGSRLAARKIGHGAAVTMSQLSPTAPLPADLAATRLRDANAAKGRQAVVVPRKKPFQMWEKMPHEIKIYIFSFFEPKELVRISRVCKLFYKTCFDGQLWTRFDASEFYQDIPAESLAKIIVAAGPFVKDLNLRGCVQVEHYKRAEVVVKACRNLINATLEGCRNFQRSTLHSLLRSNEKLTNLNLTGLTAVTNATCKIIAQCCPQLEMFNVSWCSQMDARGIKMVVQDCPQLRDLRAGEIRGFDNLEVAKVIFKTNRLQRLVLSGCTDLTDAAFRVMMHGVDPEIDILTDRPLVPPRRLRHLDISRCAQLTTQGVRALGHLTPELEGLQLNGLKSVTDAALEPIIASSPRLTLLELEELELLTNALLSEHLAKAPCAPFLEHLGLSYCENIGDTGVLPVVRACVRLRSIDLDNTRISDLVLAEAAAMVRTRAFRTTMPGRPRPRVGLSMVVYDCQNVTWTGIREVLSRNAEIKQRSQLPAHLLLGGPPELASPPRTDAGTQQHQPPSTPDSAASSSSTSDEGSSTSTSTPASSLPASPSTANPPPQPPPLVPTYPTEIIGLKCFYGWQMTVDEHTKRVLRGDLVAAQRLERKWAEYMQASEEAGAAGAGIRRRRRRAREAAAIHADEEEAGAAGGAANVGGGLGRRRRNGGGACIVM